MNAKEEARNRLDAAIRAYPKLGAQAWPEIKAAVGDIEAATVAEARAPLVEALQLVEWIDCVVSLGGGDEDSWRECACCRNQCEQGHTEDCQLAAALAKETP